MPLALLWSVAALAWASSWALDWLAHPFDDADAVRVGAVLNAYDPAVGIGVVLTIGAIGTVTAITSSWGGAGRWVRWTVVGVAFGLAAVLGLVLVHGHLLSLLGYVPVVLVLGWFEPGLAGDLLHASSEPSAIFVVGSAVGALLWGAVGLAGLRSLRSACIACGRQDGWDDAREVEVRARARRIGRIAVTIGVALALTYPAARLPWLFGFPVGLDARTWAELQASGADRAGIGLGLAAVGGAVLMTGLVARWGERFPRWMVGLAGRRVPITLAVVPASLVSIALVATGRGMLPGILAGEGLAATSGWLQILPFVGMIPWGIALAVATVAYAIRRHSTCPTCARGPFDPAPSPAPRPVVADRGGSEPRG